MPSVAQTFLSVRFAADFRRQTQTKMFVQLSVNFLPLFQHRLHTKRRAAAARFCSIRIIEREATSVQAVGEIKLYAHKVE